MLNMFTRFALVFWSENLNFTIIFKWILTSSPWQTKGPRNSKTSSMSSKPLPNSTTSRTIANAWSSSPLSTRDTACPSATESKTSNAGWSNRSWKWRNQPWLGRGGRRPYPPIRQMKVWRSSSIRRSPTQPLSNPRLFRCHLWSGMPWRMIATLHPTWSPFRPKPIRVATSRRTTTCATNSMIFSGSLLTTWCFPPRRKEARRNNWDGNTKNGTKASSLRKSRGRG